MIFGNGQQTFVDVDLKYFQFRHVPAVLSSVSRLKRTLLSNCRSRKLNAVLEGAIQEAMAELDRITARAKTRTGEKLKRRAAAAATGGSISGTVVRQRRSQLKDILHRWQSIGDMKWRKAQFTCELDVSLARQYRKLNFGFDYKSGLCLGYRTL